MVSGERESLFQLGLGLSSRRNGWLPGCTGLRCTLIGVLLSHGTQKRLEETSVAPFIEDGDGFWKEVLDKFFEDFMALLFPAAHARIDWSKGFQFRDKELQKLHLGDKVGVRVVDKLVEVQVKGGASLLVMIHCVCLQLPNQVEIRLIRREFCSPGGQ